jgi:hypothetical protein
MASNKQFVGAHAWATTVFVGIEQGGTLLRARPWWAENVLTGRLNQALFLLASCALAAAAHASYGQMRLDGIGLLLAFVVIVAYGVIVDVALIARIFRYRAASSSELSSPWWWSFSSSARPLLPANGMDSSKGSRVGRRWSCSW